jgi:hypothetical protein
MDRSLKKTIYPPDYRLLGFGKLLRNMGSELTGARVREADGGATWPLDVRLISCALSAAALAVVWGCRTWPAKCSGCRSALGRDGFGTAISRPQAAIVQGCTGVEPQFGDEGQAGLGGGGADRRLGHLL